MSNEEKASNQVKAIRITALVLGIASMTCLFFVIYANIQTGYAREQLWRQGMEFEKTKSKLTNQIDSLENVIYRLQNPVDTSSNKR